MKTRPQRKASRMGALRGTGGWGGPSHLTTEPSVTGGGENEDKRTSIKCNNSEL